MPFWPTILLALAVVSGFFGYAGFADASAPVARALCLIFAALFGLSLLARRLGKRSAHRRSRHDLQVPGRASDKTR